MLQIYVKQAKKTVLRTIIKEETRHNSNYGSRIALHGVVSLVFVWKKPSASLNN